MSMSSTCSLSAVRQSSIFGEKPTTVLRLPRGDVVLAAKAAGGPAFVLGGWRPVAGCGLVVGCMLRAGERAPAIVDPLHIAQMVRWTSIEESKTANPLTMVRAIEIDPRRRSIEEFSIAPTMLAAQHRLGGEIRIC